MVKCPTCLKDFEPRSTGGKLQVYCSAQCRLEHHRRKWEAHVVTPKVPPNLTGGRQAICERCKGEFLTRQRGGGRRQRFCSYECMSRSWQERNPHASWFYSLKKYGLSISDYEQLLKKQGGVCAICKRPPKNNRLHVDHCHKTGAVRGLLCPPCNRHVGYFEAFGQEVVQYLTPPYPEGFTQERSQNRVA